MKIASIVLLLLLTTLANAQSKADETAIRKILEEEVTTWNRGDADGYSRHFATEGTFTNVQGMFFTRYKAFRDRHEEIFKVQFHGTALQVEVVSLRFVRPDVAVVDALTWVSGFSKAGPPPVVHTDARTSSHAATPGAGERQRRLEDRCVPQRGYKAWNRIAGAEISIRLR